MINIQRFNLKTNLLKLSLKFRRLLRFETTVHNDGEAPFYPAMKKEDWIWHECHKYKFI